MLMLNLLQSQKCIHYLVQLTVYLALIRINFYYLYIIFIFIDYSSPNNRV